MSTVKHFSAEPTDYTKIAADVRNYATNNYLKPICISTYVAPDGHIHADVIFQ